MDPKAGSNLSCESGRRSLDIVTAKNSPMQTNRANERRQHDNEDTPCSFCAASSLELFLEFFELCGETLNLLRERLNVLFKFGDAISFVLTTY